MDKCDAVLELMRDFASERLLTKSSYKRVCKAMQVLDLSAHDKNRLLHLMNYHTSDGEHMAWLASALRR
jgi:hypothetical protein